MTNIFGTEHEHTATHYLNGVRYEFRFPNGYGASVIKNDASIGHEKGLWEMAILDAAGTVAETDIIPDNDGDGAYVGNLTTDDVVAKLTAAAALPKAVAR